MKKVFLFLVCFTLASAGFSYSNALLAPQDSSMVYDFPEKMAKFPGEANALDLFVRKNLIYPAKLKESGVQGKVYVQFIVEKDGSITSISVRRSSKYDEFDAAAVELIKLMPNWIPGSVRGKNVRVKQTIPINFRL